MYSLAYGTLPIVHRTGGLADTVIDAGKIATETSQKIIPGSNGFVFDTPNTESLINTIQRALSLFKNKKLWQKLQKNAMSKNFGWEKSADSYIKIYNNIDPES
jgi:starch synthase